MYSSKVEQWLRRSFDLGLCIKAFDGLIELIVGALLVFIDPLQLNAFIRWITQKELSEDPNDFVATALRSTAASFDIDAQKFAILYLLIHGIVKIIIVWNLVRNKLWAYPFSIVVFVIFGVYQCFRMTYDFSYWLLILTIIDLCLVWLIWHEYTFISTRGTQHIANTELPE